MYQFIKLGKLKAKFRAFESDEYKKNFQNYCHVVFALFFSLLWRFEANERLTWSQEQLMQCLNFFSAFPFFLVQIFTNFEGLKKVKIYFLYYFFFIVTMEKRLANTAALPVLPYN